MNVRVIRWFAPIALTCALLTAAHTSAQEQQAKHHHYKLIDLGTFGGPNSFVNCCGLTPSVLTTTREHLWAEPTALSQIPAAPIRTL